MKTLVALPEPTEAEIQKTAYYLWLQHGCVPDHDLEHWLSAKEILRHRPARVGGRTRRRAALSPQPLHFPPSYDAQRPTNTLPLS